MLPALQKTLLAILLFCLTFSLSPTQAATIYVDSVRGFNALDGSTNVVISSTQGPLRNITPALALAPSNSTLVVAEGYYQELIWNASTTWDLTGKNLNLSPQGNVQVEDNFSTAGDGLPDWFKTLNGLSLTSATVAAAVSTNVFAHGLTNLQLYMNPSVLISNGFSTLNDNLGDWWKILHGYSLLDPSVSTAFGNLVCWLKLDEGTGTNLFDSGPNGFNGTMVGSPLPQWTNGVSSNALWFAGTTNDAQVADATLLSPTNALTLLAWAQVSSNITGMVISKWTTNSLIGSYSLGYTNSQVMLQLSVEGSELRVIGGTTNADGGWHLIAGVYDGTQMTVYLDGFVDGSLLISGAVDVVSAPVVIGQVAGTINDVHIYSRGLSGDELANYSTLDDGISDWWKVAYGFSITDPTVADEDPLGQGVINLVAYTYGLDPWEPDNLYIVLNGGQTVTTNTLLAVDATASPFPFVEASLSSNFSSPTLLSTNVADLSVTAPTDGMTNYTVYLQYETASTNVLGNPFSETVVVDTVPPVVSFSPGWGGTNDLSNPLLIINYTDPASDTNVTPPGLNLSTLTIMLDGINVTSNFYISVNNAVADGSYAPTGWHTNIVSLADNIGNWTIATNIFYATGAVNPAAPVMSSFNVAGVTELPDMSTMWMQATISNPNAQYSVMVNGVADDNWRIRQTTAGSFVALQPGTNLVVVTADDGAGNLSSALQVLVRTTRYQAVITSPGVDTFDNGAAQVVSGTVSLYKDAGLPTQEPLTSVTVNGMGTTWVTNGDGTVTFTTTNAVPVPGDGTLLSLNVQLIWPDTNTPPLGVLEGYLIKSKEETYKGPQGGPVGEATWVPSFFSQSGSSAAPCQGATLWEISVANEYQLTKSFSEPTDGSTASNESEETQIWVDTDQCTAGTDPWQLNYSVLVNDTIVNNYMPQPTRLLNMGTMTEWQGGFTVYSNTPTSNNAQREEDWLDDDGSMEVHWPMQYQSGQVVLLTFEGVYLYLGGGWTNEVDGTLIKYLGQAPVVVATNGPTSFDLSYWETVTSNDTFTIEASSFDWPSLSYGGDSWTCSSNADAGVVCRDDDTQGHAHHLSFAGFHNNILEVGTISGVNTDAYCLDDTFTVTAHINGGYVLPAGCNVSWGGDASFSAANGLTAQATVNTPGAANTIKAWLGAQTSPAESSPFLVTDSNGNVPTSVSDISFSAAPVSPPFTTPGEGKTIAGGITFGLTAYCDTGAGVWRCKITQADEIIYSTANTPTENVTSEIISNTIDCDLLENMLLGLTNNAVQYQSFSGYNSVAAVIAHENVHVSKYKAARSQAFPAFKQSIEAITVPMKDYATAAAAKTAILATQGALNAGATFNNALVQPDTNNRNHLPHNDWSAAAGAALAPFIQQVIQRKAVLHCP